MACSTLYKTLPISTALCFVGFISFGQKTEIKLNVYSGSFSFHGSGSTSVSTGYLTPFGMYGRKPGFSYSFELLAKRITGRKHVFGLGISVEKLKSSTKNALVATDITDSVYPGSIGAGETKLTNSFINLNPFIGQRFFNKAITLDVLAGLDLACCLKSNVVIKMFNSNRKDFYTFSKNEVAPSVDIRPRIQLSANYKQLSLLVGYSVGLTGYSARLPGYETRPGANAYAGFLRMGIGYRFK